MSDWSPLASGDPVPGDPGAVATLARRLGTTAQVVRTQADRLAGIDPGCWEGEAAAEFRTRQGELAPKLATVAERYAKASSALDRYHPDLHQAQTTARRALAEARQAEADIHGARQGMAAMAAHAAAAERAAAAANAADPEAPPARPAPWSGPDHHARLGAAQAEMEAARRLLRQAQELRDGAASTCAGSIRAASDDSLADEGGAFGFFKRAASAINDALPVIAKVLAVAAAVVGVLSIFLPVLAPLALALGALVLVLDTILVATGRGSWVDVALGALGLLTFGLSRAFGVAARAGRTGSTGAAVAARSAAISGDEVAGAGRLVTGADDAADAAVAAGRIDYGADFVQSLDDFKPGSASFHAGPLDDELVLVQYFDEAGSGSRKWWTSLEEANRMSTVDDVHQRLALLPEWGQRNAVRVVRIPPGEDVAFLYGQAAPKVGMTGPAAGVHFAGGGEQFRLLEFDEAWLVASRAIP